ncbi:hypothetical protein BN6_70905 [Saccharothrix espanaensis DSM 44229]|uniref:Uncharacterized protein n=1 Tax=Saccharothrix espanaensis (strain ATCC 51144 / DSM 44229 / JCM 9112 / NBRC 15066 / NRRL 15764) TaxID=1179773 RepID=K0K7I0_SACES|nr:hypothetical protein BN6_70905 [Saccharothrix espanaensis DSM 44229]
MTELPPLELPATTPNPTALPPDFPRSLTEGPETTDRDATRSEAASPDAAGADLTNPLTPPGTPVHLVVDQVFLTGPDTSASAAHPTGSPWSAVAGSLAQQAEVERTTECPPTTPATCTYPGLRATTPSRPGPDANSPATAPMPSCAAPGPRGRSAPSCESRATSTSPPPSTRRDAHRDVPPGCRNAARPKPCTTPTPTPATQCTTTRPTTHPTDRPANRSTDRPADRIATCSTDRAADCLTDRTTDRAAFLAAPFRRGKAWLCELITQAWLLHLRTRCGRWTEQCRGARRCPRQSARPWRTACGLAPAAVWRE